MAEETEVLQASLESRPPVEGSSTDMDHTLATFVHLQQLQQKQEVVQRIESESADNADAGFRRGLEELVREHFNTCMALASCSSLDPSMSNASDDTPISRSLSYSTLRDASSHLQDESHSLDGYQTAPSHDDILGHYGVGHDRESDVTVHEISDTPFCSGHSQLVEQQESDFEHRVNGPLQQEQNDMDESLAENHMSVEERPRSSALSVWAAQHAQEMITTMERQAREAELLALAGLHTVSTLDASFLRESLRTGDSSMPVSSASVEERRERRTSSLVQMWRELEEERRSESERHFPDQRGSSYPDSSSVLINSDSSQSNAHVHSEEERDVRSNGTGDTRQSHSEYFPEWDRNESENIDVHVNANFAERDAVLTQHTHEGEREHVRQIVQRLMTENGVQDISSDGNVHGRSSWLDENERERVRELARAWVRVTNEQRAGVQERSGRQRSHRANVSDRTDRRSLTVQAEGFNESATQVPNRRDRRILNRQAILEILMRAERERQRELQLLVEHRAVSDFAHRQRLQSFLRGRFLRPGAVNEEERIPSSAAGELGQLRQRRAVSHLREGFRFRLESILRNQVNHRDTDHTNTRNASQGRNRRADVQPTAQLLTRDHHPIRRGINAAENAARGRGNFVPGRVADFQTMEESNEYNMELRELLGRRSVTNVLASDFRDRLDRLIRSFIRAQGRPPVAWDMQRQETGQQQQPTVVPPPPPPPPRQPLWQQEMQQTIWHRPPPPLHRASYTDGESITELRADISKLQQGLMDLHRVMDTCLEMQLDLQRSMRQELAGALQQMYEGKAVPDEAVDGSKWVSVKRGICCVCCDRNIDSLLYRCGHMCTCLNCASELMKKSGKCPMCRAPIKEVVRAFTVA